MTITASAHDAETARYRVTGMDCPSCAAKIEKAVRSVGVDEVKVSTATQIMTLHVSDPAARLPEVERAVSGAGGGGLFAYVGDNGNFGGRDRGDGRLQR